MSEIEPGKLYPIADAARILEMSEGGIRNAIYRRTIQAEKMGRWLNVIRGSELIRFMQEREQDSHSRGHRTRRENKENW